jgi:hypothetical protein
MLNKFWSFCNTQFVPVLFTVYLLHELKAPIRSESDLTVDLLLRSWGHKLARTAAGALWQPGGRAGPGTLWLDVPHHTPAGHWSAITRVPCARWLESWERLKELTSGPLGRGGAAERRRKKRAHTHAFVLSVHLLLIAHCMCAPQCFPR